MRGPLYRRHRHVVCLVGGGESGAPGAGGSSPGRIFIIDYTRRRMSPSEVIDAVFDHYARFHPMKVIIEAIGYQRTLVHWLKRRQRKQGITFFVEELKSLQGSKADRILGLQPYFAANLIAMREGMSELEHELLAWSPTPKSGHDDIVDTLSMQRKFWVDMMEITQEVKPVEPTSIMSGSVIIDELMGKFDGINQYPFDLGNKDDLYLRDEIRSDSLRARVRAKAEEGRRSMAYN